MLDPLEDHEIRKPKRWCHPRNITKQWIVSESVDGCSARVGSSGHGVGWTRETACHTRAEGAEECHSEPGTLSHRDVRLQSKDKNMIQSNRLSSWYSSLQIIMIGMV